MCGTDDNMKGKASLYPTVKRQEVHCCPSEQLIITYRL